MLEANPKAHAIADVMNSQCHLTGLESTAKKLLAPFGLTIADTDGVRLNHNCREDGLVMYVIVRRSKHEDHLYDLVTGDIRSAIWGTDTIEVGQTLKHICLPQKVEVTIYFRIEIPLPEEDLKTLRQLGKVQTSYHKAEILETVSCLI